MDSCLPITRIRIVVNAWGLDAGPTTPGGILITARQNHFVQRRAPHDCDKFTVPGAGGAQGNPTGLVFNGGTGFVVNNGRRRTGSGSIYLLE
jgi:hypothetical protein